MVMASIVYDFSSKKVYKKPTKFRYVRMIVMDNMKSETVENIVQENIDYDSVVKTDNYTSYNKIKENVWVHHSEKVNPMDVEKILPWVHTMISNAKRTLLGIHI
jgi:transposase-like protein